LAVHKIHSETTAITEDQLSKYNLLEYDLNVSFANEEELIRLFEL
ncbi:TPA: M protein trans-acting positive regulator, partial [Enterococcus faecium]|nr:M protein trans-acting positive regulator [Enterococcus faecium]